MWRERTLKIVLVVVGLLFSAGIYPLIGSLLHPAGSDMGDTMMLSLYVALGVFLLIAVRNPSEHRSLIAFAAWSSFAHAAAMSILGLEIPNQRVGFLVGSAVLVVIGVTLLALAPAKSVERVLAAEVQAVGYADHGVGHPASRNPCGSDPPHPLPQEVGSSIQSRCYEPDHQPVRWLASGFWHPHSRRSEIRKGLPNPGECLSSAQRVRHRAHLQQPMRVGEERARGRGLRTQDSREEVSAFRTEGRARPDTSAIPVPGAARSEDRRCGRIHGAFMNLAFAPVPQRTAVALQDS